jgi:hypothetical protein
MLSFGTVPDNDGWMQTTKQLATSLALGLLSILICTPLHAQSPAASADSAAQAQASQAPDDMTKRITDLVHAGKYAEAQKLTEGLLIAYPDDQRLIKAKALVEKMLAPGGLNKRSTCRKRGSPACS